ncbi:hypothetical protein FRC19_011564 [Serendipita sp. 401]|nr:hypothetical protein FRC19_011564 [Serendipita sp. 401]KAG9058213.1 hypothetical protein FS842_000154 [Serendipita sp. 407]
MDHPPARSSAISHLPTEILEEIFDFALSAWLLPGDGSNIFDDLWLFVSGCYAYKEYWRVAHIWKSLRSTCRRWYHLLEGQIIPLATTNLKFYVYPKPIGSPPIKRLETCTGCWETCNKMCGSCMVQAEIEHQFVANPDQKIRRWSTSTDLTQLDRLQVFIHQGGHGLQVDPSILTALYHAPLLRALSTYSSLYNPTNSIPPALTHLHLQGTLDALPLLQLPLLKCLDLSIKLRSQAWDYSQSTLSPFSSWVLPVLVTLRLKGKIIEEEGELVRELVVKCSQTVVNLISNLSISEPGSIKGVSLSVIYPVLHLCPHLSVLGLSISHLLRRTSIPPLPASVHNPHPENRPQSSTRSLSLLILKIADFEENNYTNREIEDNLTNSGILSIFGHLEAGYTPWSLARVIIPYNWSELGTAWDERHQIEMKNRHRTIGLQTYHPARSAWAFLSHFIGKKLEIFDADGVELHDEKNGGMTIFKPFI